MRGKLRAVISRGGRRGGGRGGSNALIEEEERGGGDIKFARYTYYFQSFQRNVMACVLFRLKRYSVVPTC